MNAASSVSRRRWARAGAWAGDASVSASAASVAPGSLLVIRQGAILRYIEVHDTQDIYIKARRETWRYAFSLRSNENSVAVVSYARMDPAYLGNTPDEELLRSRLRKMVIKNIGIMYYGLPVSRDPRSVLYGNVLGLDDLDCMSEFFEPRQ